MKKLIIYVIAVFAMTSCYSGKRVDPGNDDYYRKGSAIYYCPGGNWFEIGETRLEDVDPETFRIVSGPLSRDANWVYYRGNKQPQIDAASFFVTGELPKDKNHVWVHRQEDHLNLYASRSAMDVQSAEYAFTDDLSSDWTWIKDKDYFYLYDTRLNVDCATFRRLSSYVYADSIWVYTADYKDNNYQLNKRTKTQSPLLSIDDQGMYIRNGREILYNGHVLLEDLDIDTVRSVGQWCCVVNDMLLYHRQERLKDTVDVATLESTGMFYMKDCRRVYTLHCELKAGFDACTFVEFDYNLVKDKNHVYWDEQPLKEIDAASFHRVNDKEYEDKEFYYTFDPLYPDVKPYTRKGK